MEVRDKWKWTWRISQAEVVDEKVFRWACDERGRKKGELDIGKARFEAFEEGLCVQIMHIGPFSTEPDTVKKMDAFILQQGLKDKLTSGGKHHEIYLSDFRKCKPENMKTVLRHPVERA